MEFSQIVKGTLTILLLLFIPGYALTLALFPKKKVIDTLEKIGLSFVFGLTPILLLYFLNKNLAIPISTSTTLFSIAFVTFAGIIIYYRRIGS